MLVGRRKTKNNKLQNGQQVPIENNETPRMENQTLSTSTKIYESLQSKSIGQLKEIAIDIGLSDLKKNEKTPVLLYDPDLPVTNCSTT